jgi:septal ring factor EnvC (AmiA/AmiB activator)
MRSNRRKIDRVQRSGPIKKKKAALIPRWLPIASIFTLAVLLCLTINYRALADLGRETAENERLNDEIREAMIENIALQEQIHYLRNDSATVEREVKKYGLTRSEEKVSKPVK